MTSTRNVDRIVAAVVAAGLGVMSTVIFAAGHIVSARVMYDSEPAGPATQRYFHEMAPTVLLAGVFALFAIASLTIAIIPSREPQKPGYE